MVWLDGWTIFSRCRNAKAAAMTVDGVRTRSKIRSGMLACPHRPTVVADRLRSTPATVIAALSRRQPRVGLPPGAGAGLRKHRRAVAHHVPNSTACRRSWYTVRHQAAASAELE